MLTNRNPYGDAYPSMTGLLSLILQAKQHAKKKFDALSKEEQDMVIKAKEEEAKTREAIQEQKRVNACINQGKCPKCLGKLIRGKKDKKNGYKRTWKCLSCDKDIIN